VQTALMLARCTDDLSEAILHADDFSQALLQHDSLFIGALMIYLRHADVLLGCVANTVIVLDSSCVLMISLRLSFKIVVFLRHAGCLVQAILQTNCSFPMACRCFASGYAAKI